MKCCVQVLALDDTNYNVTVSKFVENYLDNKGKLWSVFPFAYENF